MTELTQQNQTDSSGPRLLFLTPAKTSAIGGVLRFSAELSNALSQIAVVSFDSVYPARERRSAEHDETFSVAALAWGTMALRQRLRHMAKAQPLDGVFASFHWPPKLHRGQAMIGFVHDLRSLGAHRRGVISRFDPRAQGVFQAVRSWDLCAVPTEHVADDVIFQIPSADVVVLGEGVDHIARADCQGLKEGVLVYAGRMPHKRPELAQQVAVELSRMTNLPVRTLGLEPGTWSANSGVVALQNLTDSQLASELAKSCAVAFTTAYEGFGLAVGEALWQGTGVVFDRTSGLTELVGGAGVAVEGSISSYIDGVREAVERVDELGQAALAAAELRRWDGVAQRLLALFEDL